MVVARNNVGALSNFPLQVDFNTIRTMPEAYQRLVASERSDIVFKRVKE